MVVFTTVLLFISMVSQDASFLEAIVISSISLLLFLQKQLSAVTYRVHLPRLSCSSCC
jgi:hypothetical protein